MLKIGQFDTVLNFENGELALNALIEIFNNNEPFPDIIFLDINMPIMDGWGFLKALEKYKFKDELNIYMVSSSIDPTEIKKSKKFKTVKHFISKPISAKNFLKNLKE
jgi:response regulator RpfG family c-di-GMP phosphodiesterase